MPNNIAAIKNYTTILDRVYQREATSSCLNSPASMARTGGNAKEIMIPKISVSGLGDYKRNVGYKTGSITFDYETKAVPSIVFRTFVSQGPVPVAGASSVS